MKLQVFYRLQNAGAKNFALRVPKALGNECGMLHVIA